MAKKINRGQKAWITRKANLAAKAKEKHKLVEGLKEAVKWRLVKEGIPLIKVSQNEMPFDNVISLSKALDNSLDRLEQRMADYIARVDRILA